MDQIQRGGTWAFVNKSERISITVATQAGETFAKLAEDAGAVPADATAAHKTKSMQRHAAEGRGDEELFGTADHGNTL